MTQEKPDIQCRECTTELVCTQHGSVGEQCEYNPIHKRAKYCGEPCFNQIEFTVGANGRWLMCASCASLPEFKRLKKTPNRTPVYVVDSQDFVDKNIPWGPGKLVEKGEA